MVVIDAVKHELDYGASVKENNIKELQAIYQNDPNKAKPGGAFTIISKSKSEEMVSQRDKSKMSWNPDTGEKKFWYTEKGYDKAVVRDPNTGKEKEVLWNKENREKCGDDAVVGWKHVNKLQSSTKMYEAKDARTYTKIC